ncbi:MAG: metal-dependent hydrolase [Pirellulales bacterium]|nr:metal-dependent hydrolase [Pirellulales bacterium]
MAGFKTHITISSVLGVGYTGVGLYAEMPVESALIAGGLCGIGGMLPDIDSDSGIPFRESMGFAAAIVPLLLLDRFRQFNLNYEQIVLLSGAMYLFVRFGVARLLARYTVHRGMFHSLPAALTFTGVAFLLGRSSDLQLRYFTAGGVLLGVMSHLVLDEIYAVEWIGGRWRFKKSFGTALKLWGNNTWANISTYAKMTIVVLMILSEPIVMERYGPIAPAMLRDTWSQHIAGSQDPDTVSPEANLPADWQPTEAFEADGPNQPVVDRTIYDTARRIWRSLQE